MNSKTNVFVLRLAGLLKRAVELVLSYRQVKEASQRVRHTKYKPDLYVIPFEGGSANLPEQDIRRSGVF